MATNIQITFNSIPNADEEIVIQDSLTGVNLSEVFKALRNNSGETKIRGSVVETAYSYSKALDLDYNNTSLYTIVFNNSGVVTIKANNPNSSFTILSNTTSGAVTTLIDNKVPETVFTLDSVTISEATTNPCDNVKLTITTSVQADSIAKPVNQAVSTNPFVIDVPRNESILVTMVKDGVKKSESIRVPKLLSWNFTIDKLNTPSSASITVNNTYLYTPLFTLEYSLDNVTWQSSNHFNNLAAGNYTVYIRDNIGCSKSVHFIIDSFTANLVDYDAVLEVSNLNPIRYKELIEWDENNLKTPYNTLSFEECVRMPNTSFTQPFNKVDVVNTQIKTNYSTISASIIDSDGDDTDITVFKMTNNMNITDIRDGVVEGAIYKGFNYASVKFSGGNIYDPTTQADIGDYNLGTSVPTWTNKGDYLYVQGAGWYKVLDIVYNTDAYVAVLNILAGDFPISLGTYKITSIYNSSDFERYEFAPDLSGLEGYYKIQIDVTDADFGSKTFVSEWLNVQDAHLNTALITYYNTDNNEINFNTGFSGLIRIPLADDLKWKANTEQEIYITDTNTVSLDSKYRGFWDFSARPLPTMMAEKLALILIQDRLFINQVSYVAEENVESVAIGNQYQIKASLVKSNYVFNANSGLGAGEVVLEGTPLMISQSGGFLLVE